MNNMYLNFYNNLIKLTTNKSLYKGITNKQDSFGDRLTLFLIHFAFILKEFKNSKNEKILQELYDFNFRQLELSIREIGYGDQSINKKMKDYINVFHAIVSEVHFWNDLGKIDKEKKLSLFLDNFNNINYLVEYFEVFRDNLSKNTLNSYLKSVSNQ
jgi:cytochrome b pre-mRNA-processing protein 3